VKPHKPKLKRDRVLRGDLFVVLPTLPRNSIDGIVTDPPYGISFGDHADWDAPIKHGHAVAKAEFEFQREGRSYQQWCAAWARECWRVLRPGGYLLAFSSRRLLHRMMAGIEDAGFEPRDIIAWRYKSGMPTGIMAAVAVDRARGCFKREAFAHEVYHARSKQGRVWDGWHTGLKPGFEPILVMRKPFSEKTLGHNLLRWGVGAFHVDACRPPLTEEQAARVAAGKKRPPTRHLSASWNRMILYGATTADRGAWPVNLYTCSKPSAQERDRGLDDERFAKHGRKIYAVTPRDGEKRLVTVRRNVHPTVKPVRLLRWLLRLVLPTKREMRRGIVLDPFAGSGSTGVAAVEEGFHYVMVERKRRYARMARARIAAARLDPQHGREHAKPKAVAKPAKLLSQMPRLFSS